MSPIERVVTALLAIAIGTPIIGASDASPSANKDKPASPSFVQIEDVSGLPRVLLIGDSISMGYTLPTREALRDKANVHRPPANCGSTKLGLQHIDQWLGDGTWDVIHFNFGLHDLRYSTAGGDEPAAGSRRPNVGAVEYENNLESLVSRLKKTGAKLIFATTTPAPTGNPAPVREEVSKYNAIALDVMKRHDVAVDDLYSLAVSAELQRPDDVHFNAQGYRVIAKQVAECVRDALRHGTSGKRSP